MRWKLIVWFFVWLLLLLFIGFLARGRAEAATLDCGDVGSFSASIVPGTGVAPLWLQVGTFKLLVGSGSGQQGPCSGVVSVSGGATDFSVPLTVGLTSDYGIVSTGVGDILVSVTQNPWQTFSFNLLMGLAGIVCGGGWIYVVIHHAI